MSELKRYIGTKVISAYREIRFTKGGSNDKATPGYHVLYEDGYESWSPAHVFEKAYKPTDQMTFGLALEALKMGYAVARSGWNGKYMWLRIRDPHPESDMTLPYIYMVYPLYHPAYPNGAKVPWLASQTDILNEDWTVVDDLQIANELASKRG
jgi:hypothetical protein